MAFERKEDCPNKKCPYKDNTENNPEGNAFSRKHVEKACHLCPYCESRMKVRAK